MNKSLEQYMPDGSKLPYRFMKYRIHKILLVCCSYDGYILEEDGHIESQINQEYIDLNMSNPPSLTRVSSTAEALEALDRDDSFDFILTMYNVGEPDVFSFAKIVKERHPNTPVALLTSFSKDIYRRIEEQDRSGLDYIFSWHGNTELIIAIIKLIEDKMNADEDIREGGVQAILLVEDSIRFYSTYLPEIYKLLLLQNTEFLKDAFNEQQQVLRKRARPKILLARCYEEAVELYERYKKNLLGVISDVGFVLRRNDPPESEKLDAGIDLCRRIREDNPLMPVLLQSSQVAFGKQAAELGAGFIAKNSKTLLSQLHDYIAKEFAFGDFVFKDPDTGAEIGRAKDLTQMQQMIATIPDRAFEYHTSQNHLSKWLYSRGLFPLASSIRQYNKSHFSSVEEHRRVLVGLIRDYRTLLGQGVVARFDTETYSDAVAFARIGEGSLGGKARGLAFMNSMLMKHRQYDKHENVRIMIPRSVVIATEFFDDFIRHNGLKYIISQDFSDEEVWAWIARRQEGYRKSGIDYLLALDKATGQPVGQIGVLREEINGEKVWGVGYILRSDCRKKGYATEGARRMAAYAFEELGADKIICDICPINGPSLAVARRLHMTETGSFVKLVHGVEMVHQIFVLRPDDLHQQ